MLRSKRSAIAEVVSSFYRQSRKSAWYLASGSACLVTALSTGVVGTAGAQEGGGVEEIMVTGSRLRRDGMSTPTPVTAVSYDEMRAMAPTLIMDALDQMPQFRQNDLSHTGNIFSASGGANAVNLRGIGSKRTLTLLNGRRVVSGQQAGTVDVSILPTALINRVEVVTGGASAAYGSDAISGVTNFILDMDFTGVKGNLTTGMTDRRDHDNYQVEFAAGTSIGQRGHLIASVDYYDADGVMGLHDRDWHEGWAMFTPPVAAGQIPLRFYARPGRSRAVTPGGLITGGPLGGTQFIDGVPTPLGAGSPIVGNTQVGGGGRDLQRDWAVLRPDDKRHSIFANYAYDFDNDRKGYVQVLRGQHAVDSLAAPLALQPFWGMTIFADNPFIPESIAQRMANENIASFPYTRVFEQIAPSRRVTDDTTQITLGFDGQITDRLFLSTYYQYGENIELADYSSNGLLLRMDRFYRALDSAIDPATGRVACRANLPAFGGLTPAQEAQVTRTSFLGLPVWGDPLSNRECVPFNPFAPELPQEAIDYMTSGVHHRQRLRQDMFELTLQTDLGQQRRQGPISLGGGISYREEWVFQDAFGNAEDPRRMQDFGVFRIENDPIPIRGVPAQVRDRGIFYTGNPNNEGPIQGRFDVSEVFAESIIPMFRSTTSSASLDLHAALRYANYSGSGGVWAGKLGADWQLNDQLRFRGTWSRDTRAGTLSERFDTQTGGTTIGVGVDPLFPVQYIAATTIGGNPLINPEESDTFTVGLVYQPSWAEGLNFSIDAYDIRINDAIDQLGGLEIIRRCYGTDGGTAELNPTVCALIRRSDDPNEPGISQIYNLYINIAETVTRGVDLEASYQRQVNWFRNGSETFGLRLFANYLSEVSTTFVGVAPIDRAGELQFPEWLATASFSYSNGPFRMNWQTRYRDKTIRDVQWTEGVHIVDNSVASRTYTNLNLSYNFDWAGSSSQLYFYVGNLFDKDPPLVPGAVGALGPPLHTNNGVFDTLGRTFTLGVRFDLGS